MFEKRLSDIIALLDEAIRKGSADNIYGPVNMAQTQIQQAIEGSDSGSVGVQQAYEVLVGAVGFYRMKLEEAYELIRKGEYQKARECVRKASNEYGPNVIGAIKDLIAAEKKDKRIIKKELS
mgnify:CR=1 FL=1